MVTVYMPSSIVPAPSFASGEEEAVSAGIPGSALLFQYAYEYIPAPARMQSTTIQAMVLFIPYLYTKGAAQYAPPPVQNAYAPSRYSFPLAVSMRPRGERSMKLSRRR